MELVFVGMAARISALLLVMVMLVRLSQIEAIAVMSVDLGSEWMKIAIVSVISVSTCAAPVLDSAYKSNPVTGLFVAQRGGGRCIALPFQDVGARRG